MGRVDTQQKEKTTTQSRAQQRGKSWENEAGCVKRVSLEQKTFRTPKWITEHVLCWKMLKGH